MRQERRGSGLYGVFGALLLAALLLGACAGGSSDSHGDGDSPADGDGEPADGDGADPDGDETPADGDGTNPDGDGNPDGDPSDGDETDGDETDGDETDGDETDGDEPPDFAPVESLLELDEDGRLSESLNLETGSGIRLELPAGTRLLTEEGDVPQGQLRLVLESPEQPLPALPPHSRVLQRVAIRLFAGESPHTLFLEYPEEPQTQAALSFPLTEDQDATLYRLADAGPPARSEDNPAWQLDNQALAEAGRVAFALSRSGVLALVVFDLNESPPENGFELVFQTQVPVYAIYLIEEYTALVLAAHLFMPNATPGGLADGSTVGPVQKGTPDEPFWVWLEREGNIYTLRVRSTFANLPILAFGASYGPRTTGRFLGPYRVSGGQVGEVLGDPYSRCAESFASSVLLHIRDGQGVFSEFRQQVLEPLRATYGQAAVQLASGFYRTPTGGYEASLYVDTTACTDAVRQSLGTADDWEIRGRWLRVDFDLPAVWTDPGSGLSWTVSQIGQHPLAMAQERCQALRTRGHDDWRLPDIDELRSLIRDCADFEMGCTADAGPANGCYWPPELTGLCSSYLTTSEIEGWAGHYHSVFFPKGQRADVAGVSPVPYRCVRSGK